MTNEQFIQKINGLSWFDKLIIYTHYNATMLTLKNNFVALDKTKPNWFTGYGNPHKESKNLAYYFLWKDLEIMTFEQFISEQNILKLDFGPQYNKLGYAAQIRYEFTGIYYWAKQHSLV